MPNRAEQLARAGLHTPQLIPTLAGELWLTHGEEIWRLQSAIEGVSFDALDDPAQAHAAAHFVGRWHAALGDLDHEFVGQRAGVHDTPRHIARLEQALAEGAEHRLYPEFEPFARALLGGAAALEPLPACRERVAHGDLKLNNLLFASADPRGALEPVAPGGPRSRMRWPLPQCCSCDWRSSGESAATDRSRRARSSPAYRCSCARFCEAGSSRSR